MMYTLWSVLGARRAPFHKQWCGWVQTSTLLTKQSILLDTAPRLAMEKKADALATVSTMIFFLVTYPLQLSLGAPSPLFLQSVPLSLCANYTIGLNV